MTIFTFLLALAIGFSLGKMYVNRQIRQHIAEVDQFMTNDTPIGDELAHELKIILAKIDAGDRA